MLPDSTRTLLLMRAAKAFSCVLTSSASVVLDCTVMASRVVLVVAVFSWLRDREDRRGSRVARNSSAAAAVLFRKPAAPSTSSEV
jgi:hypothetical protein